MQRSFPRSFEALGEIYAFTDEILAAAQINEATRKPVQLALEELFTNMVKYSPGSDHDIQLEVSAESGCVTVTLTDFDVDEFDVTTDRGVDTAEPLARREPGGLGLHLVQRMVDSLEYEYRGRQSTVKFTKESG